VGKLLGAVYSPLLSTVPHAEPLQPVPVTVHVTLVVGLTWEVNCWVPLKATVVALGKSVTEMWTTFTVADADLLESAADVAVTVTVAGFGGAAGAV
jgi:hypothetical protein